MDIGEPRGIQGSLSRVIGEKVLDGVPLLEIVYRVSIVAVPRWGHGYVQLPAVIDLVMQIGKGSAVDIEQQVIADFFSPLASSPMTITLDGAGTTVIVEEAVFWPSTLVAVTVAVPGASPVTTPS